MATAATSLPSGRVTFAFIDVVGSTRTFLEHGQVYADAVTALHARVAEHAERAGGAVVETEGDGAFLAFPDARSAVTALVALQDELENPIGDGLHLRIRSGAHTGDATPVGDHYLALAVYVAARISAAANAGQVLVTDDVIGDLLAVASPHHTAASEVGSYALKDITEPVRIWRITGDDTLPRATPARRTNVQPSRTSFLGRETELDRLRELTAEPGVVTVVGPGGTGKTRLVSEFALADADAIPGGVWLVELATLESPDQVVSTAAAAVGLSTSSIGTLSDELARRGRSILVLDNCEHLIDQASEVAEALANGCPELTVLCTSREALAVAAERAWTLAPLPADEAATELFLERAEFAARDAQELELVRELCVALDGLPLAIELAAGQARAAPLAEILRAVRSGTDPLVRRGGQERQRSLDSVLGWSLSRLTPAARDSLLALSAFPGRFSPEMARALLEAAPRCDPEATRVLARASLIDLDGADYRLLSTVRAASQRVLTRDPELHGESLDALVQWAAAFGEERFQHLTVHEDVPDDTVLAVEAAVLHGLETGAGGLGKVWEFLFLVTLSRGASRAVLDMARRAVEGEPTDSGAAWQIATAAMTLAHHGHDSPLDPEHLQAMEAIARAADDMRLLERVLAVLAFQAEQAADFETGLHHRQEILRLTETRPEVRHIYGAAVGNVGHYRFREGDLAAAEEHMRRAAEFAAAAGEWSTLAWARYNLAEFCLLSDRSAEARDFALAALRDAVPGWRHRGEAAAMLARAYAALGDLDAALAAGRQAVDQMRPRVDIDAEVSAQLDTLLRTLPQLRAATATPPEGRAPAR
jgi:predicted ATPase/class 3 adenylate cyclase